MTTKMADTVDPHRTQETIQEEDEEELPSEGSGEPVKEEAGAAVEAGATEQQAEPAAQEPAAEPATEPAAAPESSDQPPADAEQTEAPAEQAAEATAEAPAAETEGEQQQETDQPLADAEGQAEVSQEDAVPAEGEPGEAGPAEEGKAVPGDGEAAPVEGETAPEEGEAGEKTEEQTGEDEATAQDEAGETQEAEDEEPVPQSDTFAEGERPESALAIGEKLSREGTPTSQVSREEGTSPRPLDPGTPEQASEGEEEEYQEEEEEFIPEFDREQLIERYHQSIQEREQLQQQNYQLQHKLAEYFRKKKSDESRQDIDKNVTDQEQRYLKYMANLDELRRQDMDERENYKLQIEELQERCMERQERVDEERAKFMDFKKAVAVSAVNSRSGKPILPKDIEQYLTQENKKEAEVVNVRLENIKLKNKLKKKEMQLKSKEELAEGLHLIDFEQLKIENQTYNEKIEERNEELLKLRKKITSTVQVLTHLKEKLQFVQAENHVLKDSLHEVEDHAAKKRDILSRTKQARDGLRIDNTKLRQNCGLLGNEPLLRDFEERKDEGDDLRTELEELKMKHAELTLTCNGVRRKIDQARAGRV